MPLEEIALYCSESEKKLTVSQIEKLLPSLERFGIYYRYRYFIISDKYTYANYSGGKSQKAREREFDNLPLEIRELVTLEGVIAQSLGNGWASVAHINSKPEIVNSKSEIIKEEKPTENRYKKSRAYLESEQFFESLQEHEFYRNYEITKDYWKLKVQTIINWYQQKGKAVKDYPAAFRNWLSRDIEDGKIRKKSAQEVGAADWKPAFK